jgi:hypothetical protein
MLEIRPGICVVLRLVDRIGDVRGHFFAVFDEFSLNDRSTEDLWIAMQFSGKAEVNMRKTSK